jgi:hypothetical protein
VVQLTARNQFGEEEAVVRVIGVPHREKMVVELEHGTQAVVVLLAVAQVQVAPPHFPGRVVEGETRAALVRPVVLEEHLQVEGVAEEAAVPPGNQVVPAVPVVAERLECGAGNYEKSSSKKS